MVVTTFWYVSQQDVLQERLHAVITTVQGVTSIADDVFSKGNIEINHNVAVLSLLETA